MLIQLNGKTRELPGNWSAGQLVGDLQLTGRRETYLAGSNPRKRFASASCPIDGTIF